MRVDPSARLEGGTDNTRTTGVSAAGSSVTDMEFDAKTLEAAQPHLYDPDSDDLAPMIFWGGLLLLQDGEELLGSLVQAKESDGATSWRLLWVTPTRIIYSEASKALGGWNAYTPDDRGAPDELVTWCRPLADVERLELTGQTTARQRQYSDLRSWDAEARLILRDGPAIELPLFGGRPGYRGRAAVDELIKTLVAVLWR